MAHYPTFLFGQPAWHLWGTSQNCQFSYDTLQVAKRMITVSARFRKLGCRV